MRFERIGMTLVRVLVIGALLSCGSSTDTPPDEVARYNATGTWSGMAQGIEVRLNIESDIPQAFNDFRGGAWFITSPEDTIPLTILGESQTPTFNTLFVIFSFVPGAGEVAENLGQFYGSFAGPNMLVGEMRGSQAEGGPFVSATVSITLEKE